VHTMAVMNMADVMTVVWKLTVIKYEPMMAAEAGDDASLPSDDASPRTIGNTMPPHRAVTDGTAGLRIKSVSTNA